MSKRDAFVQAMVDIANDDTHGYSQASRWLDPDVDCSSMVYIAAYRAGYDISHQDPRYTGTIIEDFEPAGFRVDEFDGNLDDLEPGDILLNEGHVAVYVGGGQLAEASIAETGGIYGQGGDQTGEEVHIRSVYGGWDYVLTPPPEEEEDASVGYEIKQNLTPYNYEGGCNSPRWIVIHNTANGQSYDGMAYNNTQYFKNGYRGASAHYFIDDGNVIWQAVNDGDTAWHCGDSWSHNGCTNYNSIGIEVCERADGSFSEHEIAVLSWFVPMLMRKYGIDASHVCRHHDVTGKICPAGYIDQGAWNALKARITSGQEEDEVTPQDKQDIANMVIDRLLKELPDKTADAVAWKHHTVDGKQGWTIGGALKNVPNDVINYKVAGVKACDRLYGIDAAANAAKANTDELLKRTK